MAKKAENKGGRPTVLTEGALGKIETALAFGCTIIEACAFAEVSHDAFYRKQRNEPKWKEKCDRLREHPVIKARMEVIKSFAKRPELAMKYLERKKRDEFGEKVDVTVTGEDIGARLSRALKKKKDAAKSE